MYRASRHHDCDTTRQLGSLQLDAVLSELDRARLAKHVASCQTCAELVATMELVAMQLRSEPALEPAQPVVVPGRVVAHKRARRFGAQALRVGLVASALGAALVIGMETASLRDGSTPQQTHQRPIDVAMLWPVNHADRSRPPRRPASSPDQHSRAAGSNWLVDG